MLLAPAQASPLSIRLSCDQARVSVGDPITVHVAITNDTGASVKILEKRLSGTGLDGIEKAERDLKLISNLTPRSSWLETFQVQAARTGEYRVSLRLRTRVVTPRGSVFFADIAQTPAIVVTDPGMSGGGGGGGFTFAVVLGAGIAVASVLLLDYLRGYVRKLGERRRIRNLLFVTLGLRLEAVRHSDGVPLEAWETLLLTDGYAGQIDALARWKSKGPFSMQLSELYPELVQYNRMLRDRRGVDSSLQDDLQGRLETLRETVQKL